MLLKKRLKTKAPPVGEICYACRKIFERGQNVCLIALGPGASEEARRAAQAGLAYDAIAIPIHWACATGEE